MIAGCGGALGALILNNLLRIAKIKKIEAETDHTEAGYAPIMGSKTDWTDELFEEATAE